MRTAHDILQNIKNIFKKKSGQEFDNGSAIGLYTDAIAHTLEDVYAEIENNKTPHVWSFLQNETLDSTGEWVNLPRATGESDSQYKYRLTNWMLINEAANTKAIQLTLLNPTKGSNYSYFPKTRGAGTGTCYIIPKMYEEPYMTDALQEAQQKVESICSAGTYVEYIIPTIRNVILEIFLHSDDGDIDAIKINIAKQIKKYIDGLAPGEYLEIGKLNKIGIETPDVNYFNVISLFIDNDETDRIKVLQAIDSKFIFDTIKWIDEIN